MARFIFWSMVVLETLPVAVALPVLMCAVPSLSLLDVPMLAATPFLPVPPLAFWSVWASFV